jgi:hypothetical protein
MCVNDWRVGRLMSANTINFTTVSSTNLVTLPNRQRVGLLIKNSILFTANQGFAVTFTGGAVFALNAYVNEMRFTLAADGPFMQQGFTISILSGVAQGSIIETTLPEDYLAAAIGQFRSDYKITN